MRRPRARLERLHAFMGHASIETTAIYVHHTHHDLEAAVVANETRTAADVLGTHHERRQRRNQSLNSQGVQTASGAIL